VTAKVRKALCNHDQTLRVRKKGPGRRGPHPESVEWGGGGHVSVAIISVKGGNGSKRGFGKGNLVFVRRRKRWMISPERKLCSNPFDSRSSVMVSCGGRKEIKGTPASEQQRLG